MKIQNNLIFENIKRQHKKIEFIILNVFDSFAPKYDLAKFKIKIE